MACNCKINQKITRFYKKYGYKTSLNKNELAAFKTVELIKLLLVLIICIIFLPFIILVLIIYFLIGGRNINLNKILTFLLNKK